MRNAAVVLLALVLGSLGVVPAYAEVSDPTGVFSQANAAYVAGRYDEAAAQYRQLAENGYASPDVLFNLGTAELRAGRRGHAILAFERALRVDPQDEDAAFNLAEAMKGNVDRIVGEREEESLLERIGARVPANPAAFAFVILWVVGFVAVALRLVLSRGRGSLLTVGVVCLALSVPVGALLGASVWQRERAAYAIVVAASVPVREGPAHDFKPAFEVHEGLKVRVVRVQDGFLRIRLANGIEGWVSAKDVPII